MKLTVIVLLAISMTLGGVAAVSTVMVDIPGHIHINKGNRAGLQITPATLEFGNVTAGDAANITLTLFNTGNCYENVTVTGIVNGISTPMLPGPFTINPAQTTTLIAEYTAEMTLAMPPGDYNFDLSWTATCI
jgi:hypothetical protein